MRPPKSATNTRDAFRELHTISSWRNLRRGLRTDHQSAVSMTLKKLFVRFNPADFGRFSPEKHCWTALKKVPVDKCASRTCLQVFFESDGGPLLQECEISNKSPRPKLGRVRTAAFIVVSKPLSQIPGRAYIWLFRMRFRLQQVNVKHLKVGLPAVALRFGRSALAKASAHSLPSQLWYYAASEGGSG